MPEPQRSSDPEAQPYEKNPSRCRLCRGHLFVKNPGCKPPRRGPAVCRAHLSLSRPLLVARRWNTGPRCSCSLPPEGKQRMVGGTADALQSHSQNRSRTWPTIAAALSAFTRPLPTKSGFNWPARPPPPTSPPPRGAQRSPPARQTASATATRRSWSRHQAHPGPGASMTVPGRPSTCATRTTPASRSMPLTSSSADSPSRAPAAPTSPRAGSLARSGSRAGTTL